ncbi:MAG: hypothetical protein LBQ67_00705, partial [Treponema sp.]|nr:hypothetical protein [Treponema sp.]
MADNDRGGRKSLRTLANTGAKILFFGILAAATALVFRPFRTLLENRMTALRDSLIEDTEEYLGYKIEYASMGPSIFNVLDIRGIRFLREDGSELVTVDRLRLSYSLWEILDGRAAEALRSIRLDRPVLALDFEKDARLFSLFSSASSSSAAASPGEGGSGNIAALFHEGLQIRIRNGSWEASGSAFRFSLGNLGFDASLQREGVVFKGKWTAGGAVVLENAAVLELPGLGEAEKPGPVSVSLAINGQIDGEYLSALEEGNARLIIPLLSGENLALKPLALDVLFRNRRLEIRKGYDQSPSSFSVIWDLDRKKINASFEGENFSPQDLVSLTGPWKAYDPMLALTLSGSASLEKEDRKDMVYSFDLSGSLPRKQIPGKADFVLSGSGDEKMVRIRELGYNSEWGSIGFRGDIGFDPLLPDGLLSFKDFGFPGSPKINSEILINTKGREINLFAENFSVASVALSALEASFLMADSGLDFAVSALRFRDMGGYEDIRLGSFSLEGSLDYEPRHVQASLRLDSFSAADMLVFAGLVAPGLELPGIAGGVAENLSITTEFFFTTDYEHILYNAPRLVAAYEGAPRDILAVASLSGTDRRFELSDGQISWSNGSGAVNLSADFSNPEDISFFLEVSHKDLAYYLEGMFLDRRSLSIRGSYGLQVYLSAAPMGGFSGYAQGENIPIPSGDQYARLTFLMSLRYDSLSFWSAYIERFEVNDIVTPASSYGALSFSGGADQDGAQIGDFLFNDGRSPLKGTVSFTWDRSFSEAGMRLGIQDAGGSERYEAEGAYSNKVLELSLRGENMQFARFLKNSRSAVASGSLKLLWESRSSFRAESELSSLVFRWQDKDLRIRARAFADS